MIYQEINLLIWAQLVLIVVPVLVLPLLAYTKPVKDVEEENSKNHLIVMQKSDMVLIFNSEGVITIKEAGV